MYRFAAFVFLVCILSASQINADTSNELVSAGVLDQPLPQSHRAPVLNTRIPAYIVEAAGDPLAIQQALRTELKKEQKELNLLPRPELQERAEQGERAAQITLAEDYAEEATHLAFAPAAANDAMSDAMQWYSLAAQRGFPGAPSLDQAGVKIYPIRVQRSR